jgi:hypothetical protein
MQIEELRFKWKMKKLGKKRKILIIDISMMRDKISLLTSGIIIINISNQKLMIMCFTISDQITNTNLLIFSKTIYQLLLMQ